MPFLGPVIFPRAGAYSRNGLKSWEASVHSEDHHHSPRFPQLNIMMSGYKTKRRRYGLGVNNTNPVNELDIRGFVDPPNVDFNRGGQVNKP